MCYQINAFALSGRCLRWTITQGVALGYILVGLSGRIPQKWNNTLPKWGSVLFKRNGILYRCNSMLPKCNSMALNWNNM